MCRREVTALMLGSSQVKPEADEVKSAAADFGVGSFSSAVQSQALMQSQALVIGRRPPCIVILGLEPQGSMPDPKNGVHGGQDRVRYRGQAHFRCRPDYVSTSQF